LKKQKQGNTTIYISTNKIKIKTMIHQKSLLLLLLASTSVTIVTVEGREQIYQGANRRPDGTVTFNNVPQVPPTEAPITTATATTFVDASNPKLLAPECDTTLPSYNTGTQTIRPDTIGGCANSANLCDRQHGEVQQWNYDQAEQMIDQCFSTCVQQVGLDVFCTLKKPPTQQQPAQPYCSEEQQDKLWTNNGPKTEKENELLRLLNVWRSQGISCTNTGESFDPTPPVTRNPQLDCAARAQAKKIVEYSMYVGFTASSPSLHDVCDRSGRNCDHFSERMEKAGYENWWGYIHEVANYGYHAPLQALTAWKDSTSGHCPVLSKQQWRHVQTEVGIGCYEDPDTKKIAYVMVTGQQ
jgi:uncharacterized protein YkwD